MTSLVAYYRVSTQRQGRSGLGLEAQQAAVREYAARAGATIAAEFTEVESGRAPGRPQLAAALARARQAGATVVVAKLDRLARDARFVLALVDAGARLLFLDLPDLPASDPIIGRLILTVMAAVAEFEARRIGQRVRDALARYKARGGRLGRADPRCPGRSFGDPSRQRAYSRAGLDRRRQLSREHAAAVGPVARELRAAGLTLAQVAAELAARGIPTRRGKRWTAGLVHHLLTTPTEDLQCPTT